MGFFFLGVTVHQNDAEGPSTFPVDELVCRAKGDGTDAELARVKLAENYKPLVLSIAAPFIRKAARRDSALSEDIIQAGYLGLFMALSRFDPARGGAFAGFARKYILGASRRVAQRRRDAWATIGNEPSCHPGTNDSEVAMSPAADADMESDEALRLIHAFVEMLPDRLRLAVRRVFWDGATQTEVAKELGLSKMMVTKLMAEVRRRGQLELADLRDSTIAA